MSRAKQIVIIVTVTILIVLVLLSIYTKKVSKEALHNDNVKAFLSVIRYAEGTAGVNGYRTMFTGKLFDSYGGHPNIKNCIPLKDGGQLCSTAAGAYQFLFSTWSYLKVRLALGDFSPANQDLAAVELIREKGALEDVIAGNFSAAIAKVNKVWASLPGSPYGQPVKTLAELQTVYSNEGGNIA